MSNLKVNTINDASGGSNAVLYGVAAPANSMGFRNRIINGGMVIDQRNAGASVTPTDAQYTLDRWFGRASQASKYSVQQNAGSVTPPAGFSNYLGATSLSAYSVGASEFFSICQSIEGFNVADLGFGTANAQTVTLSFWVRSSLTGTFGGVVASGNNSRTYPFTFNIASANTWEQKSVTVAGDTTAGGYATNNAGGLQIIFGIGAGATVSGPAGAWSGTTYRSATGATSVVGTSGATFYITGVQLEAGSVASPFERRDYGRELMMCQRYTQVIRSNASSTTALANLGCLSTTRAYGGMLFEMQMRSSPVITFSAANTFNTRNNSGSGLTLTAITAANINAYSFDLDVSVSSGLVAGDCTSTSMLAGTSGLITISAEL
jgi:hypothetical protein